MSKLNNWFIYTELSTNGCFDENDNIMNKKTTTFELSTGENIEFSSGIVSDDDVYYCSGFSSNLIYVSDHGASSGCNVNNNGFTTIYEHDNGTLIDVIFK